MTRVAEITVDDLSEEYLLDLWWYYGRDDEEALSM